MIPLLFILTLCSVGGLFWLIQQIQLIEEYEREKFDRRIREVERKLETHLGLHEHREKYGP